jgi:hypothetical protein
VAEETEAEDRDDDEEPASDKRTRPYDESVNEQSDVDAMGEDKRRSVVGGQYGATVRKRVLVYGAALAVMVGIVVAFLTVVTGVDNKEIALKDTAPWTKEGGAEVPPRDIDFKANGPNDTIPVEEITNR